jgi:hypothetical protein
VARNPASTTLGLAGFFFSDPLNGDKFPKTHFGKNPLATMEIGRAPIPWHLWVVGGIGLLWNAYGGFDSFMWKIQGEVYLR